MDLSITTTRFVRGLFLLAAVLGLSSCAETIQDLGLETVPDIEQRTGPVGTPDRPFLLDPFKKYEFVMAAGECRYLQEKVPSRWSLKISLTAVNRHETGQGVLKADIKPADPQWDPVPNAYFKKTIELTREGEQTLLGVVNNGPNRMAVLRLCQEGPPLSVTIESQVYPYGLWGDPDTVGEENRMH